MARAAVQSNILAAQQQKLNPNLELPVGDLPATPAPQQAPPSNSGWLESMVNQQQPQAPAPEAGVQAPQQVPGLDQGLQSIEQEVIRHQIPSMRERGQQDPQQQRWLRPVKTFDSQQPDGGLRGRAKIMADNVQQGNVVPNLKADGALLNVIERAGAVTANAEGFKIPAPEYTQVASAVVENDLANGFFGGETDTNFDPEEQVAAQQAAPKDQIPVHEGNGRLGNQIHQEFQRMQGVQVPDKLAREEAEVLGAAFKDMWAMSNPEYVTRTPDPATGQHVYQLTSAGEASLRKGSEDRARLFPKVNVKPAKNPLPTGELPGDVGENITKKVAGHSVGKPKFGRAIEEARINLASVPNVVDKTRAKILYSTLLPVLASGDYSTWQAEINNMGQSKVQGYQAAAEDKMRAGEIMPGTEGEYVQSIMDSLTDKVAQEVRAIAQERNGANYLSYSVQGFNGRIQPQQTFFNPTSSKAVRFVTRNAVPAMAKPGSRIEKNLRQMYAMMMVKGADTALPQERERMLTAASPQLEAWGDMIAQAVTMSDAEYEAVSQAIVEGKALNDPAYQAIKPVELQDEALIAAIKSKGEDGPHFMDGLVDFAKYQKAKRAGRPHPSFFNAYIDGKTNGLASNGIQMGHLPTAQATGVVRSKENRSKLLDGGDIRDQLQDIMVESIYGNGWEGNVEGYESELNEVASKLMADRKIGRNLHKAVTMTFGYGKEISSFAKNVEASIGEMAVADPEYRKALEVVEGSIPRNEIAKKIIDDHYASAIRSVMSDEAMEARDLMRGAAALHAATNSLFSIKGPTDMDINLGRDVAMPYEMAELTRYEVYQNGQRQERYVAHKESEATSAAAKSKINEEDGSVMYSPGEVAFGGSVVAPVQAIDAATVALTASGRSWEKLKAKSGNNPYLHTIYDAFKMDAMGYDTIMEEVNDNWLNTSMKWSYLQSTYDATLRAMTEFKQKMSGRKNDEPLSQNERAYMDWFLAMEEAPFGGKSMKNLRTKLPKFKTMAKKEVQQAEMKFAKAMRGVGYDVHNPPENPNVAQLKTFFDLLRSELNLSSRLSAAIKNVDGKKAKLKQEILKDAYKVGDKRIALQYYAH